MDGYEGFKQDLNRMPTDRRSSQNATISSDPRTPTAGSRKQASNQRHVDSPYPCPEESTRAQGNDTDAQICQRHEPPRQYPGPDRPDPLGCTRAPQAEMDQQTGENRRVSLHRSRNAYAQLIAHRPRGNLNTSGQSLSDPSRTTGGPVSQLAQSLPEWETGRPTGRGRGRQPNPNNLRFRTQESQDSYNVSGRPLNLSEFAESQTSPGLPERFNASGRPFNLSKFATEPTAPQRQTPDSHGASGRPLNLSKFVAEQSRSQERGHESFTASGRSLNLSETATGPAGTQSHAGHPSNLTEFDRSRSRSLGRAPEQYNASGRPLNLSEFTAAEPIQPQTYNSSLRYLNFSEIPSVRPDLNRAYPDSLNTSNRLANAPDFGGNRSESAQPAAVNQSPALTLADRVIPDSQTESSNLDSGNRRNFVNKASLSTSDPRASDLNRRERTKDPVFRDGSGREFYRDISTFDSGFETRQQASRETGESRDICSTLTRPFSDGSHRLQDEKSKSVLSKRTRLVEHTPTMPHDGTSPHITSCHKGTPECPKLPEDKLPSFLQHGGTKRDPPTRHPLFDTLVRDTYFPGAIDDAVNGKIDFNAIAFDKTFGSRPIPDEVELEEVPISLVQAFEERLNYEDDLRECFKRRREFCLNDDVDKASKTSLKGQSAEEEDSAEEPSGPPQDHARFWIHRDELKLASTVDIDLATNYRDQPETGLTTALSSLAKAEKMNKFDRCVHMAEEAIRKKKEKETPEEAALKSSCSFHMNLQKDETKAKKTYHPIEIISYVGTTKPRED